MCDPAPLVIRSLIGHGHHRQTSSSQYRFSFWLMMLVILNLACIHNGHNISADDKEPPDACRKCSQLCNQTTLQCGCITGYLPDPSDGTKCRATNLNSSSIWLSTNEGIYRWSFASKKLSLAVQCTAPIGIDFAYNETSQRYQIFWVDNMYDKIYTANVSMDESDVITTNTSIEVMSDVSGMIAGQFVVDSVNQRMYYVDSRNYQIIVTDIREKRKKKVAFSESFGYEMSVHIGAIAVDPSVNALFLIVSNKLMRAALDGNGRRPIASAQDQDGGVLKTLALDKIRRFIYWTTANALWTCDYEGKHKRLVLNSSKYLSSSQSVDIFEDLVYWTDWSNEGAVYAIDKMAPIRSSSVITIFPAQQNISYSHCARIFHPLLPTPTQNESDPCAFSPTAAQSQTHHFGNTQTQNQSDRCAGKNSETDKANSFSNHNFPQTPQNRSDQHVNHTGKDNGVSSSNYNIPSTPAQNHSHQHGNHTGKDNGVSSRSYNISSTPAQNHSDQFEDHAIKDNSDFSSNRNISSTLAQNRSDQYEERTQKNNVNSSRKFNVTKTHSRWEKMGLFWWVFVAFSIVSLLMMVVFVLIRRRSANFRNEVLPLFDYLNDTVSLEPINQQSSDSEIETDTESLISNCTKI